jgi:hypothetical protein
LLNAIAAWITWICSIRRASCRHDFKSLRSGCSSFWHFESFYLELYLSSSYFARFTIFDSPRQYSKVSIAKRYEFSAPLKGIISFLTNQWSGKCSRIWISEYHIEKLTQQLSGKECCRFDCKFEICLQHWKKSMSLLWIQERCCVTEWLFNSVTIRRGSSQLSS